MEKIAVNDSLELMRRKEEWRKEKGSEKERAVRGGEVPCNGDWHENGEGRAESE